MKFALWATDIAVSLNSTSTESFTILQHMPYIDGTRFRSQYCHCTAESELYRPLSLRSIIIQQICNSVIHNRYKVIQSSSMRSHPQMDKIKHVFLCRMFSKVTPEPPWYSANSLIWTGLEPVSNHLLRWPNRLISMDSHHTCPILANIVTEIKAMPKNLFRTFVNTRRAPFTKIWPDFCYNLLTAYILWLCYCVIPNQSKPIIVHQSTSYRLVWYTIMIIIFPHHLYMIIPIWYTEVNVNSHPSLQWSQILTALGPQWKVQLFKLILLGLLETL